MKLVGINPEISQVLGRLSHLPRSAWRRIFVFIIAAVAAAVSMAIAPNTQGTMGAALAILMAAIAASDASRYIIPDELTAASAALALLHAALSSDGSIMMAITAAMARGVITACVFWSIKIVYRRLRGREGLGLGDVKLAGVAGAWLDWRTIPIAVEIAALSGLAVYVIWQYALGRPLASTGKLPFGAYFAPAIWFGWLLEIVMRGAV
jgi:leader peptidase (prepilin peptidase)/N-methyltransferase